MLFLSSVFDIAFTLAWYPAPSTLLGVVTTWYSAEFFLHRGLLLLQEKQYQMQSSYLRFPLALVPIDSEMPLESH